MPEILLERILSLGRDYLIGAVSLQGGSLGRDCLMLQCTVSGETPVMAAAKGGHVAALEALAEAGSETGATCSLAGCSGVDSLMLACRWAGRMHHAFPNRSAHQPMDFRPSCILQFGIIRHDRVEAVRWLLKRGLLPGRRDGEGRDALMHAAASGSRQAAEVLLAAKTPPDLTSRDSK